MSEQRPTHHLKSHPKFFQAVWVGDKPFEIRLNDRDFRERDEVVLGEYGPQEKEYTGRVIHGFIRYLTDFEQRPGFVVFTLEITNKTE